MKYTSIQYKRPVLHRPFFRNIRALLSHQLARMTMIPNVSVAEQKLRIHFAALYVPLLVSSDDLNNMAGIDLALCDEPVLCPHAVSQHCHRRRLCVSSGPIAAEISP